MSTKRSRILVIGDTHCPGMLEGYPDFLWDTYKSWRCDRVVHIGDFLDWHAINFHGKNPGTPAVQEEVGSARKQVARITKMFPHADWMIGNHDALPSRHAEESGLPPDMLRSESDYWDLPKGWSVQPRYKKHVIDNVIYSHGETGPQGENAAKNQSRSNFQSTVIGHLHACSGVSWTVNHRYRIFGMSVGCGMDWRLLQFSYGVKFKHKPAISCGVVIEGEYAYVEPMRL